MKHIVKDNGYSELFSPTKYKNSIIKTLYAVAIPHQQALQIANTVCNATDAWLQNKHEVTSLDIRVFTRKQLEQHSTDAALLYKKYGNMW